MPDSAPLSATKRSVKELQVTTGAFPSSQKLHVAGKRYGNAVKLRGLLGDQPVSIGRSLGEVGLLQGRVVRRHEASLAGSSVQVYNLGRK